MPRNLIINAHLHLDSFQFARCEPETRVMLLKAFVLLLWLHSLSVPAVSYIAVLATALQHSGCSQLQSPCISHQAT